MPLGKGFLATIVFSSSLYCQTTPISLLSRLSEEAQGFRDKIRAAISEETLAQRAFLTPPHTRFAIGAAAADPLRPRYFLHEIVSEYSVAPLKGSSSPQLAEFREFLVKDGAPVSTPEKARRALRQDLLTGEEHLRKRTLEQLTALGLVDVATDYALLLMAFTGEGMKSLELAPGPEGYVGTEAALSFDWRQTSGGALEFRGKKVARLPMQGTLWIRRSDGFPLRITCRTEHIDGKHTLRDEGIVDYVPTTLGFAAPAAVVHRHFMDGQSLTENLYSYQPFRLFTTDTRIDYTAPKQ
jgi:hypothetical protein